jgi:predicted nuclease with TOPRIM domain
MQRLGMLGKVLNRHVSTEDVTEEYVDTDARLRNLKRTEERLLAHLDRTGELKGIVEVERELNRVREEIERLEGRLRYLSHRVDFSTFNVTFQEKPKAEPVVPPETFSIAKIASQATRGLVGFLQGLSKCIVWLGIWSVVWVPLLLLVLFLARRAIRQFRTAPK